MKDALLFHPVRDEARDDVADGLKFDGGAVDPEHEEVTRERAEHEPEQHRDHDAAPSIDERVSRNKFDRAERDEAHRDRARESERLVHHERDITGHHHPSRRDPQRLGKDQADEEAEADRLFNHAAPPGS